MHTSNSYHQRHSLMYVVKSFSHLYIHLKQKYVLLNVNQEVLSAHFLMMDFCGCVLPVWNMYNLRAILVQPRGYKIVTAIFLAIIFKNCYGKIVTETGNGGPNLLPIMIINDAQLSDAQRCRQTISPSQFRWARNAAVHQERNKSP